MDLGRFWFILEDFGICWNMLVYFGICWKISGRNRNEKDFPQAYCNILSVGIRVLVSEQMSFFQLVCI